MKYLKEWRDYLATKSKDELSSAIHDFYFLHATLVAFFKQPTEQKNSSSKENQNTKESKETDQFINIKCDTYATRPIFLKYQALTSKIIQLNPECKKHIYPTFKLTLCGTLSCSVMEAQLCSIDTLKDSLKEVIKSTESWFSRNKLLELVEKAESDGESLRSYSALNASDNKKLLGETDQLTITVNSSPSASNNSTSSSSLRKKIGKVAKVTCSALLDPKAIFFSIACSVVNKDKTGTATNANGSISPPKPSTP